MRLIYVLFMMCLYSLLVAQDVEKQIIIKKSDDGQEMNTWVEKEKLVSVDVMKDDNGERKVKIVMDSDGEQSVYEWSDTGEIPEDVKKQLEEAGIDLQILDGSKGTEVEEKVIEIEWDGEGDMPEELKMLKEKHGVDISEYLTDEEIAGKKKKIVMVEKHISETSTGEPTIRKRIKKGQRFKTVTIDADGNQNVMEWEGDPSQVHEIHKLKSHGGGDMIFIGDGQKMNKTEVSDAYMGAQIESADGGARVLDMLKDSPADHAKLEKGDVITKINGARARSMEGLLNLLNHFEPGDEVQLSIMRGDKEKTLKMTLGERPGHFR
jgi:hypothetical protein